ncbi:MAG: hypothetical protein M3O88_06570 [Actinomycetota bacterium]|nr:hypothetical protein [Actinomycetota bacterium]
MGEGAATHHQGDADREEDHEEGELPPAAAVGCSNNAATYCPPVSDPV